MKLTEVSFSSVVTVEMLATHGSVIRSLGQLNLDIFKFRKFRAYIFQVHADCLNNIYGFVTMAY
jgi:hypothetical protein